jgi:hypothetical protein
MMIAGLLAALPGSAAGKTPADPCASFSWNVSHERAVFGELPQRINAGSSAEGAPALTAGHLYELALLPQSQARFAIAPGKSPSAESHAGIATFRVSSAGVYRIALDQPVWVDVVTNGAAIRSRDFQGRAGCNAPHKIVEFVFPADTPLTLQFSGAGGSTVRVAVLQAP